MSQGTKGMIGTAAGVDSGTAAAGLDMLRAELDPMSPPQRLQWALNRFGSGFAMTTSFGIQSSVLLHMLSRLSGAESVPVIWVDTGYLPAETYRYANTLSARLGTRLVVTQSAVSPARMEAVHGRLWESDREEDMDLYLRLRKVEPLEEALSGLNVSCWASGVRRGQTELRNTMTVLDPIRDRLSLRPLLGWTKRDVFYYMQEHDLPQHPLFDQGYSTVGDWHSSAPDGVESEGRSTRFGGQRQECGIHVPGVMGDGI
ncbi:phosphoadenylyl-sulfate reductase [Synechococcus sp. MIT S9504]|uniref:phosphoadenylyl-sulfate reductase n=1 Tax=Synechococcus sp. MIT S9504 TaxID=1801628 RepID=UPI0007BAFF5E|nr:Phosphoadenosine phosphosulfate reductase [Synechococcus sp. MIT S9504]